MIKNRAITVPRDDYPLAGKYPIDITESIGVSPLYQRLHWHDFLEINYIEAGSGYYIINGKTFEFQRGDILLINSNELHRAYEREGLHIKVCSFDRAWFLFDQRYDPHVLSPFSEMGIHFSNLLDRNQPGMKALRSIFHEMEDEHRQKLPSYVSMVRSLLLRFLAYVYRDFRIDDPLKGKANSPELQMKQLDKIREVITVMEERYGELWDLSSLSALVFLSPSRFSAIFKQTVGVSPIEYLIQIRIEKALRMLEETDRKIVDIAWECGFRNLSNFNRLYKQLTGNSPSETRESKPQ